MGVVLVLARHLHTPSGLLEGGHIFVYDVVKDELWLVIGKPEFIQQNPNNEDDKLHTKTNEMAPAKNAEKEIRQQLTNSDFPCKRGFFQQSLKVSSFTVTHGHKCCIALILNKD